jgi:hypothetical protein
MDFKKHFETAWNLTLKSIVPLILMTLAFFVVSVLTLGILAPFAMAGYMQSILLLIREGREPKVQDIFSEMRLFWPLLAFSIVIFLAVVIGMTLLILPGILVIAAVAFSCLYVIPLMTDKKLGLIEAIRRSYALSVQDSIIDQIVVVILYIGISAIGSSVFIGWLFTQPLATLLLLSVYNDKTKPEDWSHNHTPAAFGPF